MASISQAQEILKAALAPIDPTAAILFRPAEFWIHRLRTTKTINTITTSVPTKP
jgi:hypothetical protein